MEPTDLYLQENLRHELKDPMGELIEGTIEETKPILFEKLSRSDKLLIGVGDVTAKILVELGLNPQLVITDGLNKRAKFESLDFQGYTVVRAKSPAAIITKTAWEALIHSKYLIKEGKKVHLIINGEEDLLVLPILVEFENNSRIVYGQPNVGSVIRIISDESKEFALNFLSRMKSI